MCSVLLSLLIQLTNVLCIVVSQRIELRELPLLITDDGSRIYYNVLIYHALLLDLS